MFTIGSNVANSKLERAELSLVDLVNCERTADRVLSYEDNVCASFNLARTQGYEVIPKWHMNKTAEP